jgi:hypothetical protein
MTPITDIRKTELAHEVSSTLKNRGITLSDRVDIIDIVMKSLLAKKRQYDRRKK